MNNGEIVRMWQSAQGGEAGPDVVQAARLLTRRICLWETSGPRFINDKCGALKLGPDHDITQYHPPLSMASFGHSSDLSAPTSRYPNSSSTPLLLLPSYEWPDFALQVGNLYDS